MAEFQEVMKQFHRMCEFYQSKRSCPMECPMHGLNVSQCRKQITDAYVDAEHIVMGWASGHPELVYPTWCEYLQSIGVLGVERVPKDIAVVLGIKPKAVK